MLSLIPFNRCTKALLIERARGDLGENDLCSVPKRYWGENILCSQESCSTREREEGHTHGPSMPKGLQDGLILCCGGIKETLDMERLLWMQDETRHGGRVMSQLDLPWLINNV
jgi:hypothetical protein